MIQPQHIRDERAAIQRQIEVLQNASQILQRDPSITSLAISDSFDETYDWDLAQMLANSAQMTTIPEPMPNAAAAPDQTDDIKQTSQFQLFGRYAS